VNKKRDKKFPSEGLSWEDSRNTVSPSCTPCPIFMSTSKPHSLHSEDAGNRDSETLVSYRISIPRYNPEERDLGVRLNDD